MAKTKGKVDLTFWQTIAATAPLVDDDVVVEFERLCDEYGEAAGDGFLSYCESLARGRGLVSESGRRTRLSYERAKLLQQAQQTSES